MNEAYKILLVEDDDIDYKQVQRTLSKLRISNPLIRAEDGEQALQLLRSGDAQIEGRVIILLDIGLPKLSGLEVLREIRKDDALRKLSVFMLTSSEHHTDIEKAHELGISGYLVKPVALDGLLDILGKLDAFLQIIKIPEID